MQPFAIFYFSLNASKTVIFMKDLKGQSEKIRYDYRVWILIFPKEHRCFFPMVCTNLRKYSLQNLKAIQRPCRGVRESAGQAAAAASPNPSHPNSRRRFGGTW